MQITPKIIVNVLNENEPENDLSHLRKGRRGKKKRNVDFSRLFKKMNVQKLYLKG